MKGQRVSVRHARRSIESLEWDLDLLDHLANAGLRVPGVVRTDAGERHFDGVVVQEWIEGREPQTTPEWTIAVDYLKQLHQATRDYPQRPACCASTELAEYRRSVDADVDQMPDHAREQVLTVLANLEGLPKSVIHGDPGASNIRISENDEVAFLDWDESRHDVSCLDLVGLPIQVLDDATHRLATKAHRAWEAANAWTAEPDYARRQLDQLHSLA